MGSNPLTRALVALSIVVSAGEPPSEFKIFSAGSNESTKGTFVFDDVSAKSVMAEFSAHGIDLMVDYDHASLSSPSAPDPAQAGKSAAWFALEVRNGELWAINVRWTLPAAEALKRKEWRFMSPAFTVDNEGRITSLINVALTNLPATRRLDPLMAASVTALAGEKRMLDPKLVKEAFDAITAGDDAKCLEILKGILATAAAGGEAPPAETPPEEPVEQNDAPETDEEEAVAATKLTQITGQATFVGAVRVAEQWARDRATAEYEQRKANAIELTKLGAETPATTGLGLAKPKLCKRLLDEPLAEQTARIASLRAARAGKALSLNPTPTPPVTGGANGVDTFDTPLGPVTLSKRELAMCVEFKIDPKVYAADKAGKKKD